MILRDKKFYLINRSSGLTWQSKSGVRKVLEENGALIGFSIAPKSTDYIVIVNDNVPTTTTTKSLKSRVSSTSSSSSYRKPNPLLYSVFTKAKKFNVPIVMDEFVYKCIEQSTLLDHSLFTIDNILENGVVIEKNHLGEVLGFDFGMEDSDNGDKLDEDESIYSDFMMDDLLSGWEDSLPAGTASQSPEDSTFEELVLEKEWIEFNEEKEKTDMFSIQYPHDRESQVKFIKPIQEKNGYAYYYDEGCGRLEFIELPNQLKNITIGVGGFTTFIDNKKNLYVWGKFTQNISYGSIRKLIAYDNKIVEDGAEEEYQREIKFNNVSSCHRNFVSIDEKGGVWYLDAKKTSYTEEEHGRYNLPNRSYRMLTRLPDHIGLSQHRAVSVSCGYDFCALLLDNMRVVTWGRNNVGQLGRKVSHIEYNPPGLVQLENVTSISCGDHHAMVTTMTFEPSTSIYDDQSPDFTIYSWGLNNSRQLGTKTLSFTNVPQSVYSSRSKLKVFCARDYSIVMEATNNITLHCSKRTFSIELDILRQMDSIDDYELFNCNKHLGMRLVGPYQNAKGLVINDKTDILSALLDQLEHSISVIQMTKLIHLAAKLDHLSSFKLLFARYPSSRIDYTTNTTVLHVCAQHNSTKVLRYVLSHRLENINAVELTQGATALHFACENNKFDSTLILLDFGCDRNIKNTKGSTAFHSAVKNYPVGILMAQSGAQSIPDRSMKTPLQYIHGDERAILQSLIFKNEIFLSYAHKDSAFVKEVRVSLEECSLRCWLDEYRLTAGCNWRAEITKGVEGSNVVLFTVSPTSVSSLWCRKELKMAKRLCKPVVALYFHNIDIDPVLHGLFDYEIRFTDNKAWADLESSERRPELQRVGKIIKSIDLRTPSIPKSQLSKKEIFDKYSNRSIYITFAEDDHSLQWLIKEGLLTRSLPLIDRDEIQDGGQSRLEKIKQERLKKKREEKELKQKAKLQLLENQKKKLEKQKQQLTMITNTTYDISSDGSTGRTVTFQDETAQVKEQQEEVIDEVARANYYRNLYSFTEESFDKIQVQEFQVEDYTKSAVEPDHHISHLKEYIDKCLLHLVIYTDKTNDNIDEITHEIQYSSNNIKNIYVVTNNYDKNYHSCQNDILRSLPWIEIEYQREEEFYDKIVSVYEVIEKTFTTITKISQIQQQ